jgi:hypothetical protein
MHDTAAHLVNRVIPQVPVRQWVLSLPRWARFLLARDPMLITRSLDIALRTIFAHQRRRAHCAGALASRTGAITFVQRFGGALNLNVHFHCVIPDGVFVRENGSVRFVALAPPSDDEVMAVLRRIVARLDDLLRPRLASAEADARPLDALGAAQAEAMNSLGTAPPDTGRARKLAAYLHGFSLLEGGRPSHRDAPTLRGRSRAGARPHDRQGQTEPHGRTLSSQQEASRSPRCRMGRQGCSGVRHLGNRTRRDSPAARGWCGCCSTGADDAWHGSGFSSDDCFSALVCAARDAQCGLSRRL